MINKMVYRMDLETKRLMAKKKKTMKNTPGYRTSDLSSCWKCIHCYMTKRAACLNPH